MATPIEKNIKSRIQQKHDTAENWEKATGFIPKAGELIVYDIDANYDYERLKVGDGATPVTDLPFWDENVSWNTLKDRPAETTSEDIIEWMGQENAIIPLASSNGQVYATNDNKILII